MEVESDEVKQIQVPVPKHQVALLANNYLGLRQTLREYVKKHYPGFAFKDPDIATVNTNAITHIDEKTISYRLLIWRVK